MRVEYLKKKNFVIQVADWKLYDTLKWLNDIELSRLSRKVLALGLTGRHLLSVSENELISRLEIEEDEEVQRTTL